MQSVKTMFEDGLVERLVEQFPELDVNGIAAMIARKGYTNPNAGLTVACRNARTEGTWRRPAQTSHSAGASTSPSSSSTGSHYSLDELYQAERNFCDHFNALRAEAKRERWSDREFLYRLELLADKLDGAYEQHRLKPILAGARNAAKLEEEAAC